MNSMNKFNEAYSKIISEGFLRKVGQAFKSKEDRNVQLCDEVEKLLKNNGFTDSIDGPRTIFTSNKKDIKIILNTEKFKDETKPTKSIIIKYSGSKNVSIKQSDTMDDIAGKLNKILKAVGSSNYLNTSVSKKSYGLFDNFSGSDKKSEEKTKDSEKQNSTNETKENI